MRCYQLAKTVACDDIKHLRVPLLCSDDLWRFVSALDASVHFWRGKWTFGLGVLTNTYGLGDGLRAPGTFEYTPNGAERVFFAIFRGIGSSGTVVSSTRSLLENASRSALRQASIEVRTKHRTAIEHVDVPRVPPLLSRPRAPLTR